MTATPLTVLDLVPISSGSTATEALRNSINLAQAAERTTPTGSAPTSCWPTSGDAESGDIAHGAGPALTKACPGARPDWFGARAG
jgi:hypothetical protein